MKSSRKVVVVKNLNKSYKNTDKAAVSELSFSINSGEFFAFLGPNGAGKTTTISILTTTLLQTNGEVTVLGLNNREHPHKIRQQIGILFQKPALDKNLTGEENIRLHTSLYGVSKFRPLYRFMEIDYQKKIEELAEIMDLGNSLFEPVKKYSGGMKRKLEIIRSLMHTPEILFLDEPTQGLDPEARRSLWEYLKKVQTTKGTTIFLTTHYLEEAETADKVLIIAEGKKVAYGTPEQLKSKLAKASLQLKFPDKSQFERARQELSANSIDFTTSAHTISVDLDNHHPAEVLKIMGNERTYTTDIHRPTLEDTYLKIVAESQQKNHDS